MDNDLHKFAKALNLNPCIGNNFSLFWLICYFWKFWSKKSKNHFLVKIYLFFFFEQKCKKFQQQQQQQKETNHKFGKHSLDICV